MKPLIKEVILVCFIASFAQVGLGQAVQKTAQRTPQAQKTRVVPKKQKKTVSELLKAAAEAKGKQISIRKNETALPEVQAQRQQRVSAMPLSEVKPPRSGDLFREADTDEEKLEQVTDQGIEQLYKLSQQYSRSRNRG